MSVRLLFLMTLAITMSASHTGRAQEEPSFSGVWYLVSWDSTFEILTVRVTLSSDPPAQFIPGRTEAAHALLDAHAADGRALDVIRGRIDVSELRAGDGFRYRVDLRQAVSSTSLGRWTSHYLITTAGAWLWRDPRPQHQAPARLRFSPPPGAYALAPWPQPHGGWHHLNRSAFRTPSFVAFTRTAPVHTSLGAGRCTIGLLGPGWSLSPANLQQIATRLLHGLSQVTSQTYGQDILLLMIPSSQRGVHFGTVRRGGGNAIAYHVGRRSSFTEVLHSWVTWHEVAHLLLPRLPSGDAWFYEGLATYYQEVLRARMGLIPPETARRAIARGAHEVAHTWNSGLNLRQEAETMHRTRRYRLVYRIGAGLMFQLDRKLRRSGSSLDAMLLTDLDANGAPSTAPSARAICERWASRVPSALSIQLCDGLPLLSATEAQRWALGSTAEESSIFAPIPVHAESQNDNAE